MSKVVIQSKRFGNLEVPADKIISFPEGLIGIESVKQTTIIEFKHPFIWLQSLDHPDLAFLAISRESVREGVQIPHYIMKLKDMIGLEENQEYLQIFIVSVADTLKTATVNFKAPIFINPENMQAYQAVIDANKFNIRTPLWETVRPESD